MLNATIGKAFGEALAKLEACGGVRTQKRDIISDKRISKRSIDLKQLAIGMFMLFSQLVFSGKTAYNVLGRQRRSEMLW